MKKILFVFGTRPETIKLAPIIHKMKLKDELFNIKICVTSQHREMLDQMLNIFNIEPDYDLNIMKNNQGLFDITNNSLKKLEKIFLQEKPNIVLTQGDTTTTFVSSLAAFYLKIKVGHIEAGLRTGHKYNPFPEEMNRKLTSCLADLNFVPTQTAKLNLLKEGIDESKIFYSGNTIIDSLMLTSEIIDKNFEYYRKTFYKKYGINFNNKKIILVTGHRRENFSEGIKGICYGLKKIAEDNILNVKIIYPVHLNPNVKLQVEKILSDVKNVHLIEPLDYLSFIWLMRNSYLILTDSGGIQEEAPYFGKPVLITRETTERPEGINSGNAKLIGTDSKNIYLETKKLICNNKLYMNMSHKSKIYGDGNASERIIRVLQEDLL